MVTSTDVRGNGYLYIGSVRYSFDSAKPAFESAPFAMGRIGRLDEEYDTRYFLNDHLGSVRAIVNQNGVVTAEYDYMPYGMQHKNSSLATSDDNTFRYNGKEFLSRFCVDLYDSQARLQGMNARFNSIDPLAGEMPDISPYAYCAGNPIIYIDPNGKEIDKYYREDGTLLLDTGIGEKVFVIKTQRNIKGAQPIDSNTAKSTESKIVSGNIDGAHMENVVEIVPISTLEAAKNTIKDDGTGTGSTANQREYGGNILVDNTITDVTVGPMRGDNGKINASVNIPPNKDAKASYHSHPSGTLMINGKLNGSSAYPSPADFNNLNGQIGYLFQMRTQEIVIYDRKQVIATLPFSVLK